MVLGISLLLIQVGPTLGLPVSVSVPMENANGEGLQLESREPVVLQQQKRQISGAVPFGGWTDGFMKRSLNVDVKIDLPSSR